MDRFIVRTKRKREETHENITAEEEVSGKC